jgi:hypothetical protein
MAILPRGLGPWSKCHSDIFICGFVEVRFCSCFHVCVGALQYADLLVNRSYKMSKNPLRARVCQRKNRGRSWRWLMLAAVGWTHLLGTDILRWRNMLSTLRPASYRPTVTHTHTDATGRPQPCLSCNTFHRTFQPAGSCNSTTLKDLVFFGSVHDHNRYTTAHALTLALIFRASISSFMHVYSYMENVKYVREMQQDRVCYRREQSSVRKVLSYYSWSLIDLRVLQYDHARL